MINLKFVTHIKFASPLLMLDDVLNNSFLSVETGEVDQVVQFQLHVAREKQGGLVKVADASKMRTERKDIF